MTCRVWADQTGADGSEVIMLNIGSHQEIEARPTGEASGTGSQYPNQSDS